MNIEGDVGIKSLGVSKAVNLKSDQATAVRENAINEVIINFFGCRHNFVDLDEKVQKEFEKIRDEQLRKGLPITFSSLEDYQSWCKKCAEQLISETIKKVCDRVYHSFEKRDFFHEKYPSSEDIFQELFIEKETKNKEKNPPYIPIQKFNKPTKTKSFERVTLGTLHNFIRKTVYRWILDEIDRLERLFEEIYGNPFVNTNEVWDISDSRGFDKFLSELEIVEEFETIVNQQDEMLQKFIQLKKDGYSKSEIMLDLVLTNYKYYQLEENMALLFKYNKSRFRR